MIRVLLGEEVHKRGRWTWSCSLVAMMPDGRVASALLRGVSRQPLLDACRGIERMGAHAGGRVGLFRVGRLKPDLTCTVAWGARYSVREDHTKFAKWKPKPQSLWTDPEKGSAL